MNKTTANLLLITLFAIAITIYTPLANAIGNWELVSGAPKVDLRGVYFTSNNSGWVMGSGGLIAHTEDGGNEWNTRTTNTTKTLYDIYFSGPKGWVVGEEGVILYTSDGGVNWTPQNSGTSNSLYGVHFATATDGWAVGDFGLVLHTADGGNTWETQFTNANETLKGVYFVNTKLGWVVGLNGTIIHTANGGQSWVRQSISIEEFLYSVYFHNGNKGWVSGSNGTILGTNDGGKSWELQPTSITHLLYAVYFASGAEGWAVGDNGTILHTVNAGDNWDIENSATTQTLHDISHSETSIWVVGNAGSILKQTGMSQPSSQANELTISSQVDIDIPHEPMIKTGQLYIESKPSGAKIFLNGKLQKEQQTNITISDLPPGKYEVKLTKTNRGAAIKSVLVKEGEKTSVSLNLPSRKKQIGYTIVTSIIAGIAASYLIFM